MQQKNRTVRKSISHQLKIVRKKAKKTMLKEKKPTIIGKSVSANR